MDIPKHYSLVKEHPHSYELHDSRDGSRFHISKQHLDLGMHARLATVQKFSDGGEAKPTAEEQEVDDEINNLVGSNTPEQIAAHNAAMASLPKTPDDTAAETPSTTPPETPATPDQQASAASPPVAAAPAAPTNQTPVASNPFADFAAAQNARLDQQEQVINNAMKAEGAAQANIANTWKNVGDQLGSMPSVEDVIKASKVKDDQLQQAFASKEIDPDHYWASKNTGQKIAAGIGMILGGMGSAMSGQPNLAMEVINKAIDRDMEAQKNSQSKAYDLWKMNRESTQNEIAANLQMRNQLLSAAEAKAKGFAATMGSAESQLKLQPLLMDIERQKQENYLRMGLAQGGTSNMDPAQLVPMMVKNPEQQKQVYEEIGRAQNVAVNQQKILKAFDDASKDNTVLRTAAGYLRTPGSVMALHQLMLPNFKQIDGTVRQAAMDESFHNLTPMPGDTAAKVATKRQALIDWMTSEMAAPVSKGNGLDLSKFASTSVRSAPPQIRTMNGIPYQKVPGGWQMVQQ